MAIWCGRRDSNPHRRGGAPGSCAFGRRPHCLLQMDAREGLSPPWSRVATECLDPQPPGAALPGRVSNPHLPGNSRTSCRSTTWHWVDLGRQVNLPSTVTGIRTPVTGLRARRPDRWTITARRKESESNAHRPFPGLLRFQRSCHATWLSFRGSGATRTPRGSHLYRASNTAPHPAGSLPCSGERATRTPKRQRRHRGSSSAPHPAGCSPHNTAEGVGLAPTRASKPVPA